MVARESKKGEGSRSGLIVFSACVLAAWNVDEEEEEYRVFAAKWLRSWQQGEKTTKLHRNTTCNASTVVAGAFEFGATLCTCGEIPSRARLETKGEHAEHPSTILPLFGVFRRRANWLIYSGSNRGPIDDRRMEERERERERPLIGFIET